MKSPRQIRNDIRTLVSHVTQVRDALTSKADIEIAQIGKECRRTADILSELLKSQQLPEHYKVAVVGRFKTGKSSFVNELLGARLASEDTNPETAAITTFRHGPRVKATVRFVSLEDWEKLQILYREDPKHIDAHRIKMWSSFEKPRKNKDGELEQVFDLKAIEDHYLKQDGFNLTIELGAEGSKKDETEFRRRLKEFTSGTKPHHCLVKSIDIESTAAILDEGVMLIDTPGLDDTERFRVSLTEKAVEDVDAVLFLAKSGESYGQSDKDFLLSLLRKGNVKQLIIVITQLDVTYQQHLDNAEANDEDPESVSCRIERERQRLAKELNATLDEMGQDDSPAIRRYREQLGDVEIAFTSAKLHRDWAAKKPTSCAIYDSDPGGVVELTSRLLHMLSVESRIAVAAQRLALGSRAALLDLQLVLETKLLAITNIKDREVAEQKLRTFREEFEQASQRFAGATHQRTEQLTALLQTQRKYHAILIENVSLLAEKEIAAFETLDIGRHWRSRRSGYWGYMFDFQKKVANRIFPKVQEMLGQYTEAFADFAKSFETYLKALADDGERISDSLELGATIPLDVTSKLKESLQRTLSRAQEITEAEEQRVISLLDDFVTEEVSELIDAARFNVASVFGKGTTITQSAEVQTFYREVKNLLTEALQHHLLERIRAFGDFLVDEAKGAPRHALNEVHVLLEQADDNIRAAAVALIAGQKQSTEAQVNVIKNEFRALLVFAGEMAEPNVGAIEGPDASRSLSVESAEKNVAERSDEDKSLRSAKSIRELEHSMSPYPDGSGNGFAGSFMSWADEIREQATVTVHRLRLRDGMTGWPFEKVFDHKFLAGANRIRLVDPYLASPHQLRNLREFFLHVAESAHPREIEVVTAFAPADRVEYQNKIVENVVKDLFKNYGVTLSLQREGGLHDRFLILDHGILFKLGRGLDIFKPAVGLAEHRAASRRVREAEIDVFCRPGHRLANVA